MTRPRNTQNGLFSFKNMTRGAIGRSSIVVRFSEDVTPLHERQLMDAITSWMIAQKMLAENGGQPPSREYIDAYVRDLQSGKRVGVDPVYGGGGLHVEAKTALPSADRVAQEHAVPLPPDRG